MENDFSMIVHKFNTPIVIFPVADVHFGALEHAEKEWESFCKMIEEQVREHYFAQDAEEETEADESADAGKDA